MGIAEGAWRRARAVTDYTIVGRRHSLPPYIFVTNMRDIAEIEKKLRRAGKPFALATVVRVERPTSAKPGAKAVITADGTLSGWVGGSCTEPAVRREAKKALQDGEPRLLRLCAPETMGRSPQEGVVEVALTCVSGGTLEIYIEPQLAEPQLIVIGHQATAESLATIGKAAGFKITVLGHGITPEQFPDADVLIDELDYSHLQFSPQTAVVVTSHGNYDEESLQIALQSDAGYVALIASEKRAKEVHAYLRGAGVSQEDLSRLRSPAGIDLGGHEPGEIALSVVAEVVRLRHQISAQAVEDETASKQSAEEALDPVCGMTVDIATSTLMTSHEGQTYHFCSAGCKQRFEKHPETYLVEG